MRTGSNEDLFGQKFTRLNVIKYSHKATDGRFIWLCKCDCGIITFVPGASLRSGDRKSCGCLLEQKNNLVGKKYDKLTVIAKIGVNKKNHCFDYLCKCDCGNEIVRGSTKLKNGRSTSCGCDKKEKRNIASWKRTKPNGESGFNHLYLCYKRGAKIRNLEFSLSKDFFKKLTKQNCYWCDQKPTQILKRNTSRSEPYIYNGIDRLDSLIGYNDLNCVSSCGQCNIAKHIHSPKDFLLWIKKVYEFNNLSDISFDN